MAGLITEVTWSQTWQMILYFLADLYYGLYSHSVCSPIIDDHIVPDNVKTI